MYDFLGGNPVISEEEEIAVLEQAAALGIETFWIDAGWYGNGPLHRECWWQEVGNWNARRKLPRGLRPIDAYEVRSILATGFMAYRSLPADKHAPEHADALAAVAENKRLRPLLAEERIGLIAPDLEKNAWAAYQHHRHSDASGIIVALRGPGADSEDTVTLPAGAH